MDKPKLKKEMRVDDDLDETITEQEPDNKEILERLKKEQEINEELKRKLEREEILDEEIKTDEEITAQKKNLESFFVERDLNMAKQEKEKLSREISELISKREELEIAIRDKVQAKLAREKRILEDAEEREDLES